MQKRRAQDIRRKVRKSCPEPDLSNSKEQKKCKFSLHRAYIMMKR